MNDFQLSVLGIQLYCNQNETRNPETGEIDYGLGRERYRSFLADHPNFRPFWEGEYDSDEEEGEIPDVPIMDDVSEVESGYLGDDEADSDVEDDDSVSSYDTFVDAIWPRHVGEDITVRDEDMEDVLGPVNGEEDYINIELIDQCMELFELLVISTVLVHLFDVICARMFFRSSSN